jgi:L-threonylcarbamoyladenylate synthase
VKTKSNRRPETGNRKPETGEIPDPEIPGFRSPVSGLRSPVVLAVVNTADLDEAAALLEAGNLVAIPTETVYGLAARFDDDSALTKVFAAKQRPLFDPLIIHVAAGADIARLVAEGLVGELGAEARARAQKLMAAFWPGPLTLVLPRGPRVPDLATSGLPTVALRSPRHPLAQALLARVGPLAAPSANRFGRISPTTAAHVRAELGDRVMVLDGGPCEIGIESTIVAVEPFVLLRPGGVPAAAIEACAGVALAPRPAAGGIAAPGTFPAHYAPRKPLAILPAPVAELAAPPAGELPPRLGLLAFAEGAGERFAALTGRAVETRVLGLDLDAAARRLFAALRELDASPAERLFAEPCPSDEGLGHAIADRLMRAAAGAAIG